MRLVRFNIYWNIDSLWLEYVNLPESASLRARSEEEARKYMLSKCPEKYLSQVMPTYPVGCKRRVMDPGYLDALHKDNVVLYSDKIDKITQGGVLLETSRTIEADVLVYATGFKTQEFLGSMEITGQGGQTLKEHWQQTNGAQAYLGTTVSAFPNFAMLFGPNASPAHNSVIYVLEVQAEYIAQALVEPLLFGNARSVAVKRTAEDYECNIVQAGLKNSVWHAGCTNWTLNIDGRNCTNFPGYARSFWWKLYKPRFQDYIVEVCNPEWQDAKHKPDTDVDAGCQ